MCSNVDDFNNRNLILTAKLLKQGYRYRKIRKALSKFYYRHSESDLGRRFGTSKMHLSPPVDKAAVRSMLVALLLLTFCLLLLPLWESVIIPTLF